MNGNSAVRYETAKWLKKAYGDNRKVRGPEGGHNGQIRDQIKMLFSSKILSYISLFWKKFL